MPKIRDSILGTADYHPSGLYAFGRPLGGGVVASTIGDNSTTGLLSFFRSLDVEPDSLGNDYVPLSAVPQRGRNPKIFAIGIVPPNQTVTGRLLDRSATIVKELNLEPKDVHSGEGEDGRPLPEGEYPEPPLDPNSANNNLAKTGDPAIDLGQDFWVQYVAMCRRLKQNPENLAAVLYMESRFNPAAQNIQGGRVVAQGLNQYIESTAKNPKCGNMSDEEWANLTKLSAAEQLVYVERYFRNVPANASKGRLYRANFGGFDNPDGSLYASKAQQDAWLADHPDDVFPRASYQQRAIEQNGGQIGKGFVTADSRTGYPTIRQETLGAKVANLPPNSIRQAITQAEGFIDSGGPIPISPPVLSDAELAKAWKETGSSDAKKARKLQDVLADTNLRATDVGQKYEAKQRAQITAIQNGLNAMANVPPLRMLVNPSRFSVKSTKIVQDGNWSRQGPILEFWGDDHDKISGSGKVAGFYAIDAAGGSGGPGLTRSARNFSQSWQNFQSLYLLYKNNGGLFLSETLNQANRDLLLSTVGTVYIYYDDILYFGSFDSFTVTETDDKPFTAEYSFEFSVRASFLLDLPEEFDAAGQGLVETSRAALPAQSRYFEDSQLVRENGSEAAADLLVSRSNDLGALEGFLDNTLGGE